MKAGRNLPALATELQRQASVKRDFLAPAAEMCVTSNADTRLMLNEPYPINDIAHIQIAEYLGIPKGFYDRLQGGIHNLRVPLLNASHCSTDQGIEEGNSTVTTPLFDLVINRLLQAKAGDTRLVRTLDGNARAFLSQNFNPDLDHLDVFTVAAQALNDAGICPEDVRSCEVTERRLYLKVVSPKIEAVIHPSNLANAHGLLKEPQVVQAGFVLSNSEVGLGSLSIQQTVFKLKCTNLWTVEEAYKRRHIGRALESGEDGALFQSDTRQAVAKAELMKIRDHITDALSETRFKALVAKMQETTEVRLEGEVSKIVEVTARKFGLSLDEREGVLKHLIEGADLSLWGLTNAVTATASEAGDYDRASELEVIGGRFFNLPKSDIREIITAA